MSKEMSGNGNRNTCSGLSSFEIYWGILQKSVQSITNQFIEILILNLTHVTNFFDLQ